MKVIFIFSLFFFLLAGAMDKPHLDRLQLLRAHKQGLNHARHIVALDMHNEYYYGNLKAVQSLIDQGCDINQKNKYGLTPLMMAVQMYYPMVTAQTYYEIVLLLISRGVNFAITTNDGRTVLDICSQNTGGTSETIAVRQEIKKLLEYHMAIAS
ncbi:hypothetical protein BH09DEP1_BH09DEP1_4780 [soil metagenome]